MIETATNQTKIWGMKAGYPTTSGPPTRIQARDALIVVDVQRDFCSGGALAISGADEIVPVVNELIEQASQSGATIVVTRDWHPPNHSSFHACGGPWPEHCVQGSAGAQFHPQLRLPKNFIMVSKGESAENDRYSDFDGTGLEEELHRRGVDRVFVSGLAQDVCVRATALDAVGRGFETHVLLSATRPITPAGGAEAIADMVRAGVMVEQSCSG